MPMSFGIGGSDEAGGWTKSQKPMLAGIAGSVAAGAAGGRAPTELCAGRSSAGGPDRSVVTVSRAPVVRIGSLPPSPCRSAWW
jgi:hypothetical protein